MKSNNNFYILKGLIEFLEETSDLKISDPLPIDGREGYYKLEGTTKNTGEDEYYIIYDCSNSNELFDYSELCEVKKDDENFTSIIVIFKNWDHERDLFLKTKKRLSREEQKKLKEVYDQKVSYYIEIDEEMSISVDDNGINFLEYSDCSRTSSNKKNDLKGFIYNVSMKELKRVFNVTGSNLFNKNVRYGLNRDRTGLKIKEKFKNYIKVKFLMNYKNDDKIYSNLSKLLEMDLETSGYNRPEQFWFYHNGITIFSYDYQPIDRTGDTVKINPKKISVINGAQTLTQFFTGMEELDLEIDLMVGNIENMEPEQLKVLKQNLKKLIEEASKDIIVKTIFIVGKEKNVKDITSGLNTQIPILEEDQLADNEIVTKINIYLKSSQLKILKEGENPGLYSGIKILDFAKLYLVTQMKPGESKNFQKRKLEDVIKIVEEELSNPESKQDLLNKLNQALVVDTWWKNRPREGKDKHIELDSYGKNYFQSFVLNEIKESDNSLDDDYLTQLYNKFIYIFNQEDLKVGDFKTDSLFSEYLSENFLSQKKSLVNNIDNIDTKKLIDYINNEKENMYSISNTIANYLKSKEIDITYFRVIAIKNHKVKESYPFPNSTFNELFQWEDYPRDDKYKNFEESKFLQEINKEYPIFVLSWKEDTQEVSDLKIVKKFSFEKYKDDAFKVYNNTVEAFKLGDETKFPKLSDELKFHIRPKAANSEDTFEFSNGDLLTKRTFWANAKTVEELLRDKGCAYFFD